MIFLSSAACSLPLDCGNALMFECCLTLPPPFPGTAAHYTFGSLLWEKNYCNLRIPWIIASLVWTLVLAALYTLSFTFLSAIIGWSDWANPFSFWHSLCCQRYSGSCSGKLTLKFPRLMNLLILPITSKYYGANRWWEKVNWSARGCHLVRIPTSRIIYKEMCST